jgi:hypothetical protein
MYEMDLVFDTPEFPQLGIKCWNCYCTLELWLGATVIFGVKFIFENKILKFCRE